MRSTQWNGTDGPSWRVQCRRRKLVISRLVFALVGFFFLGDDLRGAAVEAGDGNYHVKKDQSRRAVSTTVSVAGTRIMCCLPHRTRQRRLVRCGFFFFNRDRVAGVRCVP